MRGSSRELANEYRSARAPSSAAAAAGQKKPLPSAGSLTVSGSSEASCCIRRVSTRSTSSVTGKSAAPSCTTFEGKSERAPAFGRSVKPLPAQPSLPTANPSPKKHPKTRKADRDLWVFERQAFGLGYATVAGVDEAGRGPWAGPVVAGAAIMRPYFHCEGINDSKLLTAEERDHYYDCILEGAEAWGVGTIEVDEIDRVGVSRANRWAMGIALQQLGRRIDYLLIDGFLLPEALTPQLPIVKGDRRSISIMCGGILAKVTRDRLMARVAEKVPAYGLEMHKGYPTPDHLTAMDRHGLSPLHRRSFISIRTRAELEAAAFANQSARD